MEDAYKTRGGNLFEICSRSVGDCVFKELFKDVNIVRKEKGMIVSLKEYHFKTVMERFMLNGAVKVVELRYRRDRNNNASHLCWIMKQWFSFMNLMDEKERQLNESCKIYCVSGLREILPIFGGNVLPFCARDLLYVLLQ